VSTTTAAPPPPPAAEDIPGVTRRHRLSDLYHERTNFQFIKHTRRWAILSGTLIVISLLLLVVRGLNFGIEFEGGTQWRVDVQNKTPTVAQVRDVISPLGFKDAKVQILSATDGGSGKSIRVDAQVVDDAVSRAEKALAKYGQVQPATIDFKQDGQSGTLELTMKPGVIATKADAVAALKGTGLDEADVKVNPDGHGVVVTVKKLPASPVQTVAAALAKYSNAKIADVNIQRVGPTWGRDVSRNAVKALIIFFLLLSVYLSIRFEWKMAVAAIVAVIHDIIFTIGMYALFQFQVSPATITAFLTILGFSLYDTVVVFDKVLEFQKSMVSTGRATYSEMVNRALNAVLMRSLSTSLVALLPVMSLLFVGSGILGATALEDFALALAAGLFIGSYSSIFVAAPLLAWWKEREPQYRALADRRTRVRYAAASASTGAAVVPPDEPREEGEPVSLGVPGPPPVMRGPIQPRARQQRGRKRK
jgi:preprotein translocase subunit SecF